MEPVTRIELVTFSLPRKRSTPELYGLEAIGHKKMVEEKGFEPLKAYAGRFTVCSL